MRHKSIIAYLHVANLPDSAATLQKEIGVGDEFDHATRQKYEGLLEKKWTSVVRLQKKIMDLEARNGQLQQDIENAIPTSRTTQDPTRWLPKAPARHTLQSHRSPVNCVAFHPIFSSLASGAEDSTIKIWDWEIGELELTLKAHTKAVLDLDYGGPPGGTLLASCSTDLSIKLWDPSDQYKNIRTLLGHDHSVSTVRFIPSGLSGAAPSGHLLVSASRDKTLRIWDVTTGYCLRTLSGHSDWVRGVACSFDGQWLISAGNDQVARLWNTTSGEVKATFTDHQHVIECCAFAPPTAYEALAALAGVKKPPSANSSAEYVATGSRDKSIRIWDARGTLIKTLVGHDNWVRGIVYHPGGIYLLSVGDDKTIRCWDLTQGGKCVRTIDDAHGHFVSDIRWAPSPSKNLGPAHNMSTNGNTTDGVVARHEAAASTTSIRCVVATASVDLNVHVFTS